MKNKFYLNIDSPCSEDFNSFTPTKEGNFCSICTKNVIDFTKLSREEINNYFENKENDNVCGRFKTEQLNTFYEPHYKSKSLFRYLTGIGMACITFFNSNNLQAQEIKNQNKTDNNNINTEDQLTQEYLSVKGKVSDDLGPLAGANIVIEGTTIGTTTDFDGNFEFNVKIKKGSILLISYVGYKSKKITIDNETKELKIELNVIMDDYGVVLMGKVAKKGFYSSKK